MNFAPSHKHRLFEVLLVLLIVVGLDQWTKALAIEILRGSTAAPYLGNLFRFEYAENPGAFLSLGATLSDSARFWIFVIPVAVFLFGMLAYTLLSAKLNRYSAMAFALLIAGGLSNLIDRSFRPGGRVIDFMNMGIGPLRTGIFNIADIAVMAATFMLLLDFLRDRKTAPSGR